MRKAKIYFGCEFIHELQFNKIIQHPDGYKIAFYYDTEVAHIPNGYLILYIE